MFLVITGEERGFTAAHLDRGGGKKFCNRAVTEGGPLSSPQDTCRLRASPRKGQRVLCWGAVLSRLQHKVLDVLG